jgi:hypothetical protein
VPSKVRQVGLGQEEVEWWTNSSRYSNSDSDTKFHTKRISFSYFISHGFTVCFTHGLTEPHLHHHSGKTDAYSDTWHLDLPRWSGEFCASQGEEF